MFCYTVISAKLNILVKLSTVFDAGKGSRVLCGQATGQYNTSAWGEQCHPGHREHWQQHGNFELAEKPKCG